MERIIRKMPQYWQDIKTLSRRPLKKVEIEIPDYSPSYGVLPVSSDGDSLLDLQREEQRKEVTITAEKEGLIVLARHLLTLAQDNAPSGCHFHSDHASSGFLEKGSCSMVVSKI